jgi:uncharacterized protein YecE (DUF72 family)
MRIRAGTSGYAYKEWKGPFYPETLPPKKMLDYYAGRFDTVEINNTFYRMPGESMLRDWAGRVGAGFSFTLKVPRRITHSKKLEGCAEDMDYLCRTADVLGERLGPLLVQLPPYVAKDTPRLAAFLDCVPAGHRLAFEFRRSSWFDDEVYDVLRARGMALVAADVGDGPGAPLVPTADWGYLRLRREDYDDAALAEWAARIREQPWTEAFVYFKHEDEGAAPRLASRLTKIVAQTPGAR